MKETQTPQGEQPTEVRVTVIYDLKTGGLRVSAPWDNPVLCYGMLGMARQAVDAALARQQAAAAQPTVADVAAARNNGIIVPNFQAPNDITRRRR